MSTSLKIGTRSVKANIMKLSATTGSLNSTHQTVEFIGTFRTSLTTEHPTGNSTSQSNINSSLRLGTLSLDSLPPWNADLAWKLTTLKSVHNLNLVGKSLFTSLSTRICTRKVFSPTILNFQEQISIQKSTGMNLFEISKKHLKATVFKAMDLLMETIR